MVNGIQLNGDTLDKFNNTNSEQEKIIDKFSKINVFIGSNNSGKSYFMRELFYNRSGIQQSKKEFNNEICLMVSAIYEFNNNNFGIELEDTIFRINKYTNYTERNEWQRGLINFNNEYVNKNLPLDKYVKDKYRFENIEFVSRRDLIEQRIYEKWEYLINQCIGLRELIKEESIDNEIDIYIPILRNLRDISEHKISSRDIYKEIISRDNFKSTTKKYHHIYTGQSLYKDLVAKLLGNASDRKDVRDFKKISK
jgi:hypothetical protein